MADMVVAERVRARVIVLGEELLARGLKDDDGKPDLAATFWVRASLYEAFVGRGDKQGEQAMMAVIQEMAPEGWMLETMNNQVKGLRELLAAGQALTS